mmetsp:Transcript_44691/g.97313  ORF Transcript_44691/g.97313 Transcript_44691/m.97313 type:complete len:204 (-) Transcript_44691:1303-1914(-)
MFPAGALNPRMSLGRFVTGTCCVAGTCGARANAVCAWVVAGAVVLPALKPISEATAATGGHVGCRPGQPWPHSIGQTSAMVHVRPSMRHGRFVGSAQSGLRSLHVHALATRPELLLSAGPVHCGERRSVLCAFSQRAGSASAQPTQREPQPSSSPGALPSQLHSGIAGSTSPEKSCVIQTVPSLFHAKPQNAAPNAGSRIVSQ